MWIVSLCCTVNNTIIIFPGHTLKFTLLHYIRTGFLTLTYVRVTSIECIHVLVYIHSVYRKLKKFYILLFSNTLKLYIFKSEAFCPYVHPSVRDG